MKLLHKILFFSIFLVLIFGCKPNRPQWETGYLLPLVKSEVTIDDIVNDSLIQKNDDNTISLVYRKILDGLNFDSLVAIPNSSFSKKTKLVDGINK